MPCVSQGMNPYIENLAALQQLIESAPAPTAKQQQAMQALRAKVPAPILAHFDRNVAKGRKGVSLVRHGVCSGCHLKVAVGTVATLENTPHLVLCENCGSYLHIALDEPIFSGADASGSSNVTVRKIAHRAAKPVAPALVSA